MPKHEKHGRGKGGKPKVSEAVARPTRTTVMYAVAVALVGFYNAHIDHLDRNGKAVALGIALAAVNAAVVAAENKFGVGILRNVPPKKAAVLDAQADTPPTGAQVVAGVRGRLTEADVQRVADEVLRRTTRDLQIGAGQ